MKITPKPYPIDSRSNRKEIPDISRRDHTTTETRMHARIACCWSPIDRDPLVIWREALLLPGSGWHGFPFGQN